MRNRLAASGTAGFVRPSKRQGDGHRRPRSTRRPHRTGAGAFARAVAGAGAALALGARPRRADAQRPHPGPPGGTRGRSPLRVGRDHRPVPARRQPPRARPPAGQGLVRYRGGRRRVQRPARLHPRPRGPARADHAGPAVPRPQPCPRRGDRVGRPGVRHPEGARSPPPPRGVPGVRRPRPAHPPECHHDGRAGARDALLPRPDRRAAGRPDVEGPQPERPAPQGAGRQGDRGEHEPGNRGGHQVGVPGLRPVAPGRGPDPRPPPRRRDEHHPPDQRRARGLRRLRRRQPCCGGSSRT